MTKNNMKDFKQNLLKELHTLQDKYGIDLSDQIDRIFATETPEYRRIFELEYKLEKVSNLVDHIFTRIQSERMHTDIIKEELKRLCLSKAVNRPLNDVYEDLENRLKFVIRF